MINIESFGFSKEMLDFINGIERAFRQIAINESTDATLEEWLIENIKQCEESGGLKGLTEKEKFLFSIGTLGGIIAERCMG